MICRRAVCGLECPSLRPVLLGGFILGGDNVTVRES
jgi:hypothetical protein